MDPKHFHCEKRLSQISFFFLLEYYFWCMSRTDFWRLSVTLLFNGFFFFCSTENLGVFSEIVREQNLVTFNL